jgi:hypothetical protein
MFVTPPDILKEFFSKKQQSRFIHPLFFDSPIFGNCEQVYFPSETRPAPRITNQGTMYSDLDSKTAHPDSWKELMVFSLGDSLCLKFRPQSASCDAMLTTKAESGESIAYCRISC